MDLPNDGKIVISTLATYDAGEHIMRSINRYDYMKDGKLCETEVEEFNLRHSGGQVLAAVVAYLS